MSLQPPPPHSAPATRLPDSEATHLWKVATKPLLGHFAKICKGAVIVERQARIA